MTLKTQGPCLGDFLKYVMHPAYNFISGTFKNLSTATIAAGASILGQPCKVNTGTQYKPVVAGDEGNITALCLYERPLEAALANNTVFGQPVLFLVRGPAIVADDGLPTLDVAGGTLTLADLKTKLSAWDPPVVFVDTPTNKETAVY